MHKTLKKYFIPHHENNYHPHILHTKRAVFYSLIFLLAKIVLVTFVVLLPTGVFVLPDVLAEEQRQIITLTNQARADKGLPALTVSSKLDTSAQYKSDDMATKGYFAHTEENNSVATWLTKAGYDYETAGENLAVGYSTAQDVVNAWKNSPKHYANLIDTDFTNLGVGLSGGIYNGQATVFIAQHLASPIAFEETVTTPTKIAVKPIVKTIAKIEPKKVIAEKPVQTEIAQSSTSSASVLSAKVENITPKTPVAQVTPAPVINLKAPSPIDKYIQAKSVLSPITNIFAVSQDIYLFAMGFFVVCLLLTILIEIKKQHPHVIFQTSGLIALLFVFWKF